MKDEVDGCRMNLGYIGNSSVMLVGGTDDDPYGIVPTLRGCKGSSVKDRISFVLLNYR